MELADDDPTKLDDIWRTVRLTDALEACLRRRRRAALESYRHQERLWAAGAMKERPKQPDILKPPAKKRVGGPIQYQAPEKSKWIEQLEQDIPPLKRRK